MLGKLFSVTLLWLTLACAASAQVAQSDWSPLEEDATCLVSKNYFTTPNAVNRRVSAQGMILQWYVWGDAFATNLNGWNYKFLQCFLTAKDSPDCGLPKDPAVADVLWAAMNGKKVQPGDAADVYFSNPPPPDAIKFAARGVGRCFGKDSAGFTLEELGLVQVDTPLEACKIVMSKIDTPFKDSGPSEIDTEFAKRPEVHAWAIIISNLIGLDAAAPAKPMQSCSIAPTSLAKILGGSAVKVRVDAERALTAADAEHDRLTNRTDAERFGGLNGCQIAYSLVYQGINARDKTVGKVPDDAIGWALRYETASLDGKACPPMPQALSDWAQKQPMATFQAEPDPYTSFRSRKGPTLGETFEDWRAFAGIWMSRYDTQRAPSSGAHSDCDAVLYYARSDAMGPVMNADNGPSAFQTLARLGYGVDAEAAICEYAPVSMIPPARSAYDAEESRRREAYAAEMRKRQPVVPSTLPKQNYLWKNTPTTRCYWAGDTKQGQKQVCFTN